MNLLKVLLLVFLILTVTAQQLRGNNQEVESTTEVKQCSCGKGKPQPVGQAQQKVSLLQYKEALKKLHDGIKDASADFQVKK